MTVAPLSMTTAPAVGPSQPRRLLIMGPQGSGKGTQAARLAERLGVPTVSTGDIFRANISGGTPLGKQAQRYTDHGELVPDEITDAMVRDRLAKPDMAGGFILDGYPRNAAQVETLDAILAELEVELDAVIELAAERSELIKRIGGRAAAEGRADDTPAAISRRLDIYDAHTQPLLAGYGDRGLLARVDGTGALAEITDRIVKELARVRSAAERAAR